MIAGASSAAPSVFVPSAFAGPASSSLVQPVPPQISGLQFWNRADLGITLSGSKVSQANDLSGNGRHATATGTLMPTWLKSSPTFGGGSSFQMNGGQKMATADFTVSQPCTIMVVAKLSSLSGNPGLIDDASTRQIGYVSSAGGQWAMDAGATLSGGTADTAAHTFFFIFNGASSALYIDSATTATLSGNAGSGSGTGGFAWGTQSTGYMTGEVSEIAIWNKALSATEMGALLPYTASRTSVTPNSSIVADGNSIMEGFDANPTSLGFATLSGKLLSPLNINFLNNGQAGFTTPQVDANSALVTDPQYNAYRPNNIVFMLEVVNDYNSGSSVAQCEANLVTYVDHRHAVGWTVGMCTVPPNYVMTEPDRASINTFIRSGGTGADFVIDLAADPILGLYANINNPLYYVDRLHFTTLGHSIPVPTVVSAIKQVWR